MSLLASSRRQHACGEVAASARDWWAGLLARWRTSRRGHRDDRPVLPCVILLPPRIAYGAKYPSWRAHVSVGNGIGGGTLIAN